MSTNSSRLSNSKFGELMQRVRNQEEDAARELYARYGHRVVRVVARRLRRRLRTEFDPEDFSQAVWASFFARPHLMHQFDRPESLIAFLSRMATNKVTDQCRRRLAGQKWNKSRETSLDEHQLGYTEVTANGPTPSELVATDEEFEQCLAKLPSFKQKICRLLAAGCSKQEAAEQVGVSVRTVRRVIRSLTAERIAAASPDNLADVNGGEVEEVGAISVDTDDSPRVHTDDRPGNDGSEAAE